MTDTEIDTLAREILTETVKRISGWKVDILHEVQEMDSGELIPVYSATSPEGYGSFLCEYMPLDPIRRIISKCERIFDEFELTDKKKATLSAKMLMSEDELPANRAAMIRMMAETATTHLIGSFRGRLGETLEEAVEDSELLAKSILAASIVHVFKRLKGAAKLGEITADARSEIEDAAERVAQLRSDAYYVATSKVSQTS